MAALGAAIGVAGTMLAKAARPAPLATLATRGRAGPITMAGVDGDKYDYIWGMDWKLACFEAWDPEQPRSYTNFNPFERNDESSMADTNGCFPGQSRGYTVPNRPDQSWDIMQAERKIMDDLKLQPKFNIKGRPGNFSLKWQANLGAVP
jgi:hypothetical protein